MTDDVQYITVHQFDDRSSYRRDENYPNLIFLGTVLRWSVNGSYIVGSDEFDTQVARSNNDMSLDSTAALIADNIESGEIPIFSVHSKLVLGNTEKSEVVSKLRSMDGGKLGGLSAERGYAYYLDGYKLFAVVMQASLPIADDVEKGRVWHRLVWDAPQQWKIRRRQDCIDAGISDKTFESAEQLAVTETGACGSPQDAEPNDIAEGDKLAGSGKRAERARIDGLSQAMRAGLISYREKHKVAPTARALFDWLADNDESGIINDFDSDKDTITWKRADGGLSDTTFKSFQGRFTNLKK